MQKSPNQVKNCTEASCFITLGMCSTPVKVSLMPSQSVTRFFSRSNASRSSGGYSVEENTV